MQPVNKKLKITTHLPKVYLLRQEGQVGEATQWGGTKKLEQHPYVPSYFSAKLSPWTRVRPLLVNNTETRSITELRVCAGCVPYGLQALPYPYG